MTRTLFRSFCLLLLALSLVAAGSAPAVRTPIFITKWGAPGTGNCEFNSPFGVAIDDTGNIYVSEYNGPRIQKFDSMGNYLTQWGSFGTGDGKFQSPAGIAIDGAGNIYVADSDNHRIQKFDSAGTFLTKWGTSGSGDGQFDKPLGVAIDVVGDVYVAEFGNERIQRFGSHLNVFVSEPNLLPDPQ